MANQLSEIRKQQTTSKAKYYKAKLQNHFQSLETLQIRKRKENCQK
jgi:hypothetical protein